MTRAIRWTSFAYTLLILSARLSWAQAPPGTVVAWGYNDSGQTNVPLGLSNVVAVAAGGKHCLALLGNGQVVAWGNNGRGQTNVPSLVSNAIAIAAGEFHSLALRSDGKVVAWGWDAFGQCTPPAGLSNVVAVAAGYEFSLALQSNGTVTAWGDDVYHQSDVPAGLSNVLAISGGGYNGLALRSDLTVAAWGYNGSGQTNVPTGLSNVVAIAMGSFHCLARRADGTVAAWGDDGYGQADVPDGLNGIASVAAGGTHSMALGSNGMIFAWGSDADGQINVPVGLTNFAAIAAGDYHSMAILLSPLITSKPPSVVTVASGGTTNLAITVSSGSPFGCLWSLNGLPIAAGPGTILAINNADVTTAGVCSVTVSNQYGYATAQAVIRLANSPIVLVDGVDAGGGNVSGTNASQITMSTTFGPGAEIYYTLDGSDPDFTAAPYTAPFMLASSTTIRAIAYNSAYTDWAEAAPIHVQIWPIYPLSISTPGGGGIDASPDPYSGSNLYVSNTVITLTAIPSDGWSFVRWVGDSSATTNVISLLMVKPLSIQAIFGTSINLFTNGSGQLVLNPPTAPYVFGSTVEVRAFPLSGNYFFGWANAASGFANPLLFTVTNEAGITALFGTLKSNQVSLTALPNGNGTVSVSPARNVYTNGDTVTLTAAAATNYVFTGWGGGVSGNQNPLLLTLTNSKSVSATFISSTATNPPPMFQSATLTGGLLTIKWSAVQGLTYQPQYKTNWNQSIWISLGEPVQATNDSITTTDAIAPGPAQRFYRVAWLP